MTSIMDSGAALENSRSRRLPTFDHMNLLRPSMTFSSSFGVGRSAWGTNGSIWRTANHFTDGAVDEEAVPDIRSRALQEELHSSGKTGSGSLLLSSESEGRSARSNVPWDTAVSSIQSNLSRPQNELISPTRQRVLASDSTVNGLSAQSASAYRSILSSDTSQSGEYIGGPTTQQNSHSALSNRSRQTFERSGFPEFQPAQSSVQKREQYNNSNFSSNGGLSASNSLSLRQAELAVGDGSSKQYANGVPRTTNSAMNVNFDSHARTAAVGFNTRFNSNFVANGQTHASNLQQYHSLNGTPVQDDSIDQEENQLSMSFNRLGFEDGQTQWNNGAHAQPQYPPSRQPAEINGPFARELTKTKFGYLTDERSNQALVNNASDSAQEFGYHYLPNYYKNSSFGDQATASPTASEYRRNLQSPLYSTTGTPPTGPESMRSASGSGLSSRASNGHSTLLDRKLRSLEPYSHDQQYIHANPLHPQMHYPPPPYDYATYASTMRMNPLANPYSTTSFFNAATASLPPRYPSREHDTSQIVRSPLLEDFRTNSKTNKRYELKDIYNHVVEFSGDQHGSRFIQQKLETANSDEKDQIFTEILPDSLQLMTDVFGNYVIQKLFEHGNQSQKKLLANQMKGHVFSLSLQMYGCRVVQKALEHILTDQQASMVKELESHVSKCVKDQNGNHVIQKAIERVPAEHIQFIVDAFHEQVQRLATHPYGCRVIQRMLEHCERPAKQAILHEMHQCVPTLITDQFGNYVIQHVIERGDPEDKYRVVSIVQAQLLIYSKHKFASNVVEKSIEFSEESQRKDILQQLTVTNEKGESPVFGLMRDQYGNYVIQKVLSQLQGARRQALVDQIKAQLVNLKKFSYGKQITAIEKLIFDNDNSSLSASSQSSALQSTNVSTNASTVEGRITPPRVQISKALQPHETQVALPLTLGQPRS